MPTPNANESRSDFVSRCIPLVLEEGTAEEAGQAAAICHSMWDQAQTNGSDDNPMLKDNLRKLGLA